MHTIQTITIDTVGRIVVPKPIRDVAGLVPGEPFEISFRDGVIEITPKPKTIRVKTKGRLHIAVPSESGERLRGDTVDKTIEETRRRGS